MKKAILFAAVATLLTTSAYARYIVVLKDGTRYVAKAKWTVSNGKALINLENGQSLQLDPSLIDAARSEQATRLGLTNANVIDLNNDRAGAPPPPAPKPSLGSQIKLRTQQVTPQTTTEVKPAAPAGGSMPRESEVMEKFHRAFENVGIYERNLVATGPNGLRAELTVDTEDRVFNALSATSFLMVRNAGVDGAKIDVVELFMKTTTGGAAGRFQMTRAHAEALDKRTISQQDYFVRNVIY